MEDTLEIMAATLAEDDDGEPVVSVGDTSDGTGAGRQVPFYCPVGFVGRPCLPSSNGDAAGLVVWTSGHESVVIAARDERWVDKVTTERAGGASGNGPLGDGDCAIVTDCDSRFELRRGANTVGLYSTDAEVIVDGADGTVTAKKGTNEVRIDDTDVTVSVAAGDVTIAASPTSIVLKVGVITFTISATGAALASSNPLQPAVLTVNGVPVS